MVPERSLNILMISFDFVLPVYGGVATHLHGLCPELVKMGHEVTIVVPRYMNQEYYTQFDGVNVVHLGPNPPPRFVRYLGRMMALRRLVNHLINEKKPDLLHAHDLRVSAPMARLLSRKLPCVFTHHTSQYLGSTNDRWCKMLLRSLAGRPDGVIAVSSHLARQCRAFKKSLQANIANGVDFYSFVPQIPDNDLRKALGLGADDQVILFVGRFHTVKGLKYLINAMKTLRIEFPNIRLLIIGGGSKAEVNAVHAALDKAELSSNTRVAGRIPNEQLPRYYALATIVALPSIVEASGITCLEAMASGKPLVVSNVGGLPEVVAGGSTGILVPPRDASALSDSLAILLRNDRMREDLGRAARKRTEQFFSWNVAAERTADFYERVLRVRADRKK